MQGLGGRRTAAHNTLCENASVPAAKPAARAARDLCHRVYHTAEPDTLLGSCSASCRGSQLTRHAEDTAVCVSSPTSPALDYCPVRILNLWQKATVVFLAYGARPASSIMILLDTFHNGRATLRRIWGRRSHACSCTHWSSY